MAIDAPPRRISRDTRRLLSAAGLALLCLWALARLRFPETPVATNPVPPLLAQLSPPARFADLAAEIGTLTSSLDPLTARVTLDAGDGMASRLALPVRPGIAAAIVRSDRAMTIPLPTEALAVDRPSGLMLVPTASRAGAAPRPSTGMGPAAPQYLFAATASADALILRPVIVTALQPRWSAAWRANIWPLDRPTDLRPGEFVFTAGGELVGAVSGDATGAVSLIPAAVFYSAVEVLMNAPEGQGAGSIGVSVVEITPGLARGAGVARGLIVTQVESTGPAGEVVDVGDVITTVNGTETNTATDWAVTTGRLRPDDVVRLRLYHDGREVEAVVKAAPEHSAVKAPLGLHLQRVAEGSAVLAVDRNSVAARSLQRGDIITRVGDVRQPTPAELQRLFQASDEGALLVFFTRDGLPLVSALER